MPAGLLTVSFYPASYWYSVHACLMHRPIVHRFSAWAFWSSTPLSCSNENSSLRDFGHMHYFSLFRTDVRLSMLVLRSYDEHLFTSLPKSFEPAAQSHCYDSGDTTFLPFD